MCGSMDKALSLGQSEPLHLHHIPQLYCTGFEFGIGLPSGNQNCVSDNRVLGRKTRIYYLCKIVNTQRNVRY